MFDLKRTPAQFLQLFICCNFICPSGDQEMCPYLPDPMSGRQCLHTNMFSGTSLQLIHSSCFIFISTGSSPDLLPRDSLSQNPSHQVLSDQNTEVFKGRYCQLTINKNLIFHYFPGCSTCFSRGAVTSMSSIQSTCQGTSNNHSWILLRTREWRRSSWRRRSWKSPWRRW